MDNARSQVTPTVSIIKIGGWYRTRTDRPIKASALKRDAYTYRLVISLCTRLSPRYRVALPILSFLEKRVFAIKIYDEYLSIIVFSTDFSRVLALRVNNGGTNACTIKVIVARKHCHAPHKANFK